MLRAALFTAVAVAVLGGSVASAQTIPPAKVSRELVRRMMLDACVYQESAKEEPAAEENADKPKKPDQLSAKQQKIVDACQCASTKAIKPVKDEEITKVEESRQVPDAWYQATTEAFPGCKR